MSMTILPEITLKLTVMSDHIQITDSHALTQHLAISNVAKVRYTGQYATNVLP